MIVFLLTVVLAAALCALCTGCSSQNSGSSEGTKESAKAAESEENNYHAFDSSGKNIGIYMDTPEEILEMREIPQVIGWFEDWYDQSSQQKLQLCGTDNVALPFITWEPHDIPLEEIIAGDHDEYIGSYFARLALACPNNDVLIRFAHEMEGFPQNSEVWYSWQKDLEPQVYIDAWRHVVEIARENCGNVRWVWSPNRSNEYSDVFYPGDDYVDYVGITMNLPANKAGQYADFEEYYRETGGKENLKKYGKGVIISEVAYSDDADQRKEQYLKSVFDACLEDPEIVLACFFNYDKSDQQMYRISDDEGYMDVFYSGLDRLRGE